MTHPTMQRIFDATGKTPAEIAKSIDVNPQNINNWSNRGISKIGAVAIAKKHNLSVDWILTGQGQMTVKPTIEALKSKADEIMGRTNGVEYTQPAHLYPVINEVQAGYFTELGQDSFDEWRPAHHKGSYWLRIKGDSMTPDFAQGDLILVDKDRIASTGNYVVAQVADDPKATFKKYRECFDDDKPYYQLIAINDFYPIIDSRAKPFEVIGVVVEHSRGLV